MTEFSMETAASSRVPTWPANVWVMAPSEYWHTDVKIAGPERYQSFLDSIPNWMKNSLIPVIGGMSSASATKEEAFDEDWWRREVMAVLAWWSAERSGSVVLLSIVVVTWREGGRQERDESILVRKGWETTFCQINKCLSTKDIKMLQKGSKKRLWKESKGCEKGPRISIDMEIVFIFYFFERKVKMKTCFSFQT